MPTMMTNDTARISAAVVSECRANGTTVAIIGRRISAIVGRSIAAPRISIVVAAIVGRRVAAIVRIAVAIAWPIGICAGGQATDDSCANEAAGNTGTPTTTPPCFSRRRQSQSRDANDASRNQCQCSSFPDRAILLFKTHFNGRRQAWFRYPDSPARSKIGERSRFFVQTFGCTDAGCRRLYRILRSAAQTRADSSPPARGMSRRRPPSQAL